MDERSLRLKVGALLVLALAGVLGLLALLGELRPFSSGPELEVDFGHTGNVVKHAPVKVAGVIVGRVERVELLLGRVDPQGRALPIRMTLSLPADVHRALRRDLAVTVSSQGPLGEAYLELSPGTAAELHAPTEAVRGLDAPRLDVVSDRLARLLEGLDKVLDQDPDALARLVRGVGGLAGTADAVLGENREALRGLAADLAEAARDARRASRVARVELEPGGRAASALDDAAATLRLLRRDLPELSRNASTTLAGAAALTGPLDAGDGQRLKRLIAQYQEGGAHLESVSLRADRLLARLEAGDGTLGAALADRQVFDDLRALLADLRSHPWKLLWKE
jgi:phospholipid/cholesterol/gamma-HCH transport system substrate-binding protein